LYAPPPYYAQATFRWRRGDQITFATVEHADGGVPPRARLQLFGWAV